MRTNLSNYSCHRPKISVYQLEVPFFEGQNETEELQIQNISQDKKATKYAILQDPGNFILYFLDTQIYFKTKQITHYELMIFISH